MKQNDYNEFTVLWTSVKNMYPLKAPVSTAEVTLVFNALESYSLNDVKKAISKCIKTSEYAPTPASVIKAINELHREDDASLELKANKWYMILSDGFSVGHDIVTDDLRAVIAFKQCFRTVNDFGRIDAKSDAFRRKDFIQAYVAVKSQWLSKPFNAEDYQIKGIYSSSFNPLVRFIGDIEKCKYLAKSIYVNKRPRYTTLNDLAEIEFKRSQNEKLALSGTDVPQNDKNASKELYVQKAEMEKFFQEFFDALGVKH